MKKKLEDNPLRRQREVELETKMKYRWQRISNGWYVRFDPYHSMDCWRGEGRAWLWHWWHYVNYGKPYPWHRRMVVK